MATSPLVDTRELLSEAKFYSDYSRFDEEKNRFETWDEAVDRVMNMHREFYADKVNELEPYLQRVERAYKDKRILGAQRALQFGGEQLLKKHSRLYNCTSSYADRPEFFGEAFWWLLCGAGVGFSVQRHHVEKLPRIAERKKQPKTHVVEDSIEGWATALDVLLSSYFVGGGKHPEYEGRRVYFDLSIIRPKGAYISGGFKAPGPEPLRLALDRIEHLIQRVLLVEKIDKLRPIHVYDVVMFFADAVIAGGVRRSATICWFSPDDAEMASAKTGKWFTENPQRKRSNNSALIVRSEITREQFASIMGKIKEFGEPGFIFAESTEYAVNPCFSGDTMVAVADGRNSVSIRELAETGGSFPVYSARRTVAKTWTAEVKKATAFKTGSRKTIRVHLSNGDSFVCTPEHLLAMPSGEYVRAGDTLGMELQGFFTHFDKYRRINSFSNAYANQHRMVWEYHNGTIPKGMVIDHVVSGTRDFIENLQILSKKEHDRKTGAERLGENNPIFKVKDDLRFRNNLSNRSFMHRNSRFKGMSDEEIIENAKILEEDGHAISFANLLEMDDRMPKSFSKNRFGGNIKKLRKIVRGEIEYVPPVEPDFILRDSVKLTYVNPTVVSIEELGIEDVYDLTVEDNHNFYILTSGDEDYKNSKGVLVHNCCEVGMLPHLDGVSGWQGCNLSEINGGMCDTPERFLEACEAAAIIGTLQAGYTDFGFLSPVSKQIFDREALIGVSVTGWMNNPDVLFSEENLWKGSKIVVETNKRIADIIGINPAARCTTVKPSGNASTLLMTASGIHGEHSPRYIRNVQLNKSSEVVGVLARTNPNMVEDSIWSTGGTDAVVSFPIVPKASSVFKDQILGVKHLELVKLVQQSWIEGGTNVERGVDKTVRHNVSNTITVDDWDEVEEYVFANRKFFTGISFMAQEGDKAFNQAPNTAVVTEEEVVQKYGVAGILASGLVVDALDVYENLWVATSTARENGEDLSFESKENSLKRDWNRRFVKFADNYLDGDLIKTDACLKDVYLLHRWEKIQKSFVPVDWGAEMKSREYVDINTLGAAACAGGGCELDF